MSRGEAVYAKLPTPLQHAAISAYGYSWKRRRFGGRFPEFRAGFAEREWWPADRLEQWQTERLRELIRLARTAPAYRELELGEQMTAADLARLPLLSKEQVRRDPESFCPGGAPAAGVVPWYTSGSTGTPLTTYWSREDFQRGIAVRDARYEGFAGVSYRMPRATFSGRQVEPDPDSGGPYHRFNLAERQVYFSPFHLGPRTVDQYVAALRKHRPRWLTGYATAIHQLAQLALQAGVECPPLEAVITAAEPVTAQLREDVSAAFGCRVTEEYGLIEEACFALECDRGSLHVAPDSAVVEIVDAGGEPCVPGELGEIVGTSLTREAQPLVRYRTGDMGSWAAEPCGCGRAMPALAQIEGRVDDVVVGSDGRRVTRLSTVPKNLPGVRFMQFVQERPGAVHVRVVCDGELGTAVTGPVTERLVSKLGGDTEVSFEQVDALERTERGKIRSVVSLIDSGS
jgi:phenylacetate-CoA ligase